ncbi:MAG: L-threonylcarbamoyladenylate synthase [Alphaproteobacteria bacterium]
MDSLKEHTIEKAITLLSLGGIVALPTETVYGIAAIATNDEAVAKIFALKKRPNFNPLIIHVNNLEMAFAFGIWSKTAIKLVENFWIKKHKPLTIVVQLKKESPLSNLATAGLDTIAIRIPNHPLTLKLLEKLNKPIAMPSANKSSCLSTTTAKDVMNTFPIGLSMIIDGGHCSVGIESTIIDMTTSEPIILRPGGTATEEIEEYLKKTIKNHNDFSVIKSPGLLKRHYSPSIPLRLNALVSHAEEAFLGFGKDAPHSINLNLSVKGDLTEAACNFFKMLRTLDDPTEYKGIAVMPIPNYHLGIAINDRLKRAATKR